MAATAAAAPSASASGGGTGNNNTAPTTSTTTTSRFAAACGALSQYVKAAEAERTRAQGLRPMVVRPLPLMPGADVEEEEPAAGTAQLTIVYGGRAMVLDDVTADKAAELLRLATAARGGGTGSVEQQQPPLSSVVVANDLPVARKASLQRFMEKRKGRAAARAVEPYRRPGDRRDHLTLAL